MPGTQDLVQVGDFEISPAELFQITRAYVGGEPAEEIATRLNLNLEDLTELLGNPEIFDAAVAARKNLIRLLVYGPLADRLITIASGTGDTRSQVAAIKFLRELATDGAGEDDNSGPAPTTITHNTLNVIGQLPPGGFDAVVRQVEAAREPRILEARAEVVE